MKRRPNVPDRPTLTTRPWASLAHERDLLLAIRWHNDATRDRLTAIEDEMLNRAKATR